MSIKMEEEKGNELVTNCVEVENPHADPQNVNKMENIPPSLGSGSAVGNVIT